jgi:hypothetical protein
VASQIAARSIASVMAGEISKRDSSGMSGVTTTMPLAASSWASRVNRGSSMPDTCSPEVKRLARLPELALLGA